MKFKRRYKKIVLAGIKWHLRSLVPADFLNCEGWPSSMVIIEGRETEISKLKKQFSGPGFKDKRIEDDEKAQAELAFQLIYKGVVKPTVTRLGGVGKSYRDIKKNTLLHEQLLNEIVILSYGIDQKKDFGKWPLRINKTFAQTLAFESKAMNIEPYVLFKGEDGIPSMYNPLRWDFNLNILSYGAEVEAEAITKATEEANSKTRGKRNGR
jgi:hypothetical protein